ncbi:hypothetical protein C2G38_2166448 [Gigaspora rosea]|uniref:Uncharacterized protein n=1 Tax=Gigaspora rosea TaxID=44941 RepID=A0A397VRR5_9GLOM|nr:hypothetical protein C2G38_2166448 [Gigaspora rosea]
MDSIKLIDTAWPALELELALGLTESQTTISQFTTEAHQININKYQSKSSFNILTTLKSVFTHKDPEYDEVKDLFTIKTKIHAIIKLQMPTKLENKHEKYKKSISKKIKGPDKSNGNNDIIKMENSIPKFCKSGCGLCGIVQQGNRKISAKRMWFAHVTWILQSRH